MLVGELRSIGKPAIIEEAERVSRRAMMVRDTMRTRFERVAELPQQPMSSWLDRVAALGLTLVLAVVLFLAVAALAQAGSPASGERALAQVTKVSNTLQE